MALKLSLDESETLEKIENLLDNNEDVSGRNEYGRTHLHVAAAIGDQLVFDTLLLKRVEVDSLDKSGNSPLFYCAGKYKFVDRALRWGADVNIKNSNGCIPLHYAAQADVQCVRRMLKAGASINTRNENGLTPLHIATECGNLDVVKLLIEEGANVDPKDDMEYTPLCSAVFNEDLSVAEVLLNAGADPNTKRQKGHRLLHDSVSMKSCILTKLLLDKGAEVDAKDPDGDSALILAAMNKNTSLIKLLLEAGADINGKNAQGFTPLHIAVDSGEVTLIKNLINYGADVNAQDCKGNSPLHLIIELLSDHLFVFEYAYLTIIKLLVNAGTNINLGNREGNTLLHIMALNDKSKKSIEIIHYLMLEGADIDSKNIYGNTPLHIAVTGWDFRKVQMLLNWGASVNIINNRGLTPLNNVPEPLERVYHKIFNKHSVKLECIEIVREREVVFDGLEKFKEDCLKELMEINKNSMFDVLITHNDPVYVSSKSIQRQIDSPCLYCKFPIYASLLEIRFKKDALRYSLLNKAETCFHTDRFPNEIKRKILTCLNNEELDILRKKAKIS